MSVGGFHLQNWVTNDRVLQEYFSKNENKENNFKETGMILRSPNRSLYRLTLILRVLGTEWEIERDLLVFLFEDLIKTAKSLKQAKINILKASVSFYYPLGFIAPVTARVKKLHRMIV